jgi:hypothetical protein
VTVGKQVRQRSAGTPGELEIELVGVLGAGRAGDRTFGRRLLVRRDAQRRRQFRPEPAFTPGREQVGHPRPRPLEIPLRVGCHARHCRRRPPTSRTRRDADFWTAPA